MTTETATFLLRFRLSLAITNHYGQCPPGKLSLSELFGFLSPFGDMALWNILVSCVVLPYISPYSRMTNRMLWGHIRSVAPETSSMAGGARVHLDTSHHCPGPLVTRCDRATPRGVCCR